MAQDVPCPDTISRHGYPRVTSQFPSLTPSHNLPVPYIPDRSMILNRWQTTVEGRHDRQIVRTIHHRTVAQSPTQPRVPPYNDQIAAEDWHLTGMSTSGNAAHPSALVVDAQIHVPPPTGPKYCPSDQHPQLGSSLARRLHLLTFDPTLSSPDSHARQIKVPTFSCRMWKHRRPFLVVLQSNPSSVASHVVSTLPLVARRIDEERTM